MKDWEIQFHFHIHGSDDNDFGDGFAFWYTKDKHELGPVLGSKDFFHGLGIFFDTFNNKYHHHHNTVILFYKFT
jgi:mannose-binding lectin 2